MNSEKFADTLFAVTQCCQIGFIFHLVEEICLNITSIQHRSNSLRTKTPSHEFVKKQHSNMIMYDIQKLKLSHFEASSIKFYFDRSHLKICFFTIMKHISFSHLVLLKLIWNHKEAFYGNNQTRYTGCPIRVAFSFFESFQNKIVIKRTQSKKIFSISGIVHNENLLTSVIQKIQNLQNFIYLQ